MYAELAEMDPISDGSSCTEDEDDGDLCVEVEPDDDDQALVDSSDEEPAPKKSRTLRGHNKGKAPASSEKKVGVEVV